MNDFDLHMHSCFSKDGQYTPTQLVGFIKDAGITTAALSDHDTVQGVNEMIEEGKKASIQIIPAIECSTLLGEYEVHVLGYGIDLEAPYFQGLAQRIEEKNQGVFHQRVEKLKAVYGVEIDEEAVIAQAHGSNPWFNMINGILQDPRNQDIEDFQPYLPGGKRCDPAPVNFFYDLCGPGSALYVQAYSPDFRETIIEIHKAGGLAIIAHPFRTFYHNEKHLKYALECGIDGLEAYSNYHEPEHNLYYEKFAQNHGLLITCGSDFHGKNKPSIKLGEYGLEKDGSMFLKNFLEAL